MGMSQGNSLYSHLKQTKMLFFSFTKLENRRAKQVLPMAWYQWEGEDIGKGMGG
jgi:hypothetical protein